MLQQEKAVVLRPTSAIVPRTPAQFFLRSSSSSSSSAAASSSRILLTVGSVDGGLRITESSSPPTSPPAVVSHRSPVDDADDRALSETGDASTRHDDGHRLRPVPRPPAADQSSPDDTRGLNRGGVVRRRRSDDSEFDNVDGLSVEEDRRLARV